MIGPAGGSIAVATADGTKFDLEIPAFALAQDTEIVATAAHLSGLGTPTSAVVFQPPGLFFFKDARLSIVGTPAVPLEQQYMFAVSDDASTFTNALVDVHEANPTILVQHFSGYGVAQAPAAEQVAALLASAADASQCIAARVGKLLAEERVKMLTGQETDPQVIGSAIDAALDEYIHDVIEPRLAAVGSSCSAVTFAVETVMAAERQFQLLGRTTEGRIDPAGAVGLALAEGGPCEKDAIARCQAAHDPSILLIFWESRERQLQLLGRSAAGDTNIAGLAERAKQVCSLRYEAKGGGPDIEISGMIGELSEPFTLDAVVPQQTGVLTYAPTDDRSGTITITVVLANDMNQVVRTGPLHDRGHRRWRIDAHRDGHELHPGSVLRHHPGDHSDAPRSNVTARAMLHR